MYIRKRELDLENECKKIKVTDNDTFSKEFFIKEPGIKYAV